jgi:hypothetical protein
MQFARSRWLLIAAVFAVALLFASAASAQDACRIPACDPGETWLPAERQCESRAGFPTWAISRRIPTCRAGETLDRDAGVCVLDACGGACGATARPLCTGGWTYERSARDASGVVYGVCRHQTGTYIAHQRLYCATGSTLNEARGVCVSACRVTTPTPIPRPDLAIGRVFLRQLPAGPEVTSVRYGQAYYVCYVVSNIGAVASGSFRVTGGGLGLPVAPSSGQATLIPGTSRTPCLRYSTTPAVGRYGIGIRAIPGTGVTEVTLANNNGDVSVNVVP